MYKKLGALGALVFVAACSGESLLSTTGAPQSAAPAVRHSSGLTFTVYTAGQTSGFPSTASATDLTPDSSGNMWFTDSGTPAIGRIAPNGTVTEFTSGLPTGSNPYSIVAGPDGNMWFTDFRGVAIGKVTPRGAITEYDATQYTNSKAMGVAFGPGGEPWFVGFGSQPMLAHLTKQGTIAAQLLPVLMTPNGALTSDAGSNLWFVALSPKLSGELVERGATSKKLLRTPIHMVAASEPCCPNVAPKSIVIGANGDPWFTTNDFVHGASPANYLGTLVGGKVQLIRIHQNGLSESAYPSGLAATANGLWMTGGDPFASKGALWHIDNSGKQIGYDLPYNPLGLAVDASGNPWFTTRFSGEPSQIVEVTGASSSH
jgi:sugar lactone lactonase YvrE